MKKLLLILLYLPMIGFGQQTYVPDDNFEAYLEVNGMGNGIANDDSVLTALISTTGNLDVGNKQIANLTGIEDFIGLGVLDCHNNQLTSLDVSNNINLTHLYCGYNQLTSLDLSNNPALTNLGCDYNNLTSLDVSQNTALTTLNCFNNQLTILDVSNNTDLHYLDCSGTKQPWVIGNQITNLNVNGATSLTWLNCSFNQLSNIDVSNNTALSYFSCAENLLSNIDLNNNLSLETLICSFNSLTSIDLSNHPLIHHLSCGENQLTSLDVRNGNNINFSSFWSGANPFLNCINVDNSSWSTVNWTNIDPQHYFSDNCPSSSIKEHTTNKELLKVTDLLGRETKQTNQPLFYIYDDGTVEKRIIIE